MTHMFDKESDANADSNATSTSSATSPTQQKATSDPKDGSAKPSPSMSRLFDSTVSSDIIVSYFGSLNFLDCQQAFFTTFGHQPPILAAYPLSTTACDILGRVRAYADKCMLDVFLELCREDYVGGFDVSSKRKLVHEICKIIGGMTQEFVSPRGNKGIDTPDELYAKFLSIVSALPDDASLWSITLCSAYYSALSLPLRDKMELSAFVMPALNTMGTKALQIAGLRIVRTAAVTSYSALMEEEQRMRRMFPQLCTTRQQRASLNIIEEQGTPVENEEQSAIDQDTTGTLMYTNQSQAEETLSRYGDGSEQHKDPKVNLHVRRGADGKDYPFNPDDPEYTSKFCIGFRGCFKCGKTDHWDRRSCALGNVTDKVLLDIFYRELAIHKPKFRGDHSRKPITVSTNEWSIIFHPYEYCYI